MPLHKYGAVPFNDFNQFDSFVVILRFVQVIVTSKRTFVLLLLLFTTFYFNTLNKKRHGSTWLPTVEQIEQLCKRKRTMLIEKEKNQ